MVKGVTYVGEVQKGDVMDGPRNSHVEKMGQSNIDVGRL
jgi:hypothetical protein